MLEDLKNVENLKKYLLGQVARETELNLIEERLLTDSEFSTELEIAEGELIDDYVDGLLAGDDLEKFNRLFLNVPERRAKIGFVRALKEYIPTKAETEKIKKKASFFEGWLLSPRLAFGLSLIVIAGVGLAALWFGFRQSDTDKSLAELKLIYQNERPVQARVTGLDYAPLIVLRGNGQNNQSEITRRKIEKDLQKAVEENQTTESYNALGVYYLTERQFDNAINQFETGLKSSPNDAEIRGNLGAAYFEKAKRSNSEEKSKFLNNSLEELNKALEIDNSRLEILFNKALVLQEMNTTQAAVQAWDEYLKKDANSKWADEAHRNLAKLKN
jgi:tetratricopeptide (TPR) repeat protein